MELGISYLKVEKQLLPYLDELRVKHLYNPFIWRNIEAVKGAYNWEQYDKEFRFEEEHDLKSLRAIYGTPGWYVKEPSKEYRIWAYPPADLDAWRKFLEETFKRYPKREWTIWAEPDNTPPREDSGICNFIGTEKDYLRLFKTAFEVREGLKADAKLGVGGLVGATLNGLYPTVEGGEIVNKLGFFENLVNMGIERYCDFVALDLFAYGYGGASNFFKGLKAICKLTEKPLYITETGARISHPKGKMKKDFHHEVVTEETQAGFLLKAFLLAKKFGVKRMYWLKFGPDSDWGLLNNQMKQHLSYWVFRFIQDNKSFLELRGK